MLKLKSLALALEIQVSMMTVMEGRCRRLRFKKFLLKFEFPAPQQFQTRIFIGDKLRELVW